VESATNPEEFSYDFGLNQRCRMIEDLPTFLERLIPEAAFRNSVFPSASCPL